MNDLAPVKRLLVCETNRVFILNAASLIPMIVIDQSYPLDLCPHRGQRIVPRATTSIERLVGSGTDDPLTKLLPLPAPLPKFDRHVV